MKTVSFENMKKIRWALPAGLAALGFTLVALGYGSGNKASVKDTTSTDSHVQAAESPAPTATPNITINGTTIPTDKNGTRDVNTPGGTAHVEVSDGHTRITTNDSSQSGDTSNKSQQSLDLNVSSQSTGGSSWNSTHTYGFSDSSNGTSSSYSSTSIDSFGSGDVHISH
jgi:hypothetical protein